MLAAPTPDGFYKCGHELIEHTLEQSNTGWFFVSCGPSLPRRSCYGNFMNGMYLYHRRGRELEGEK
jgi:hypothetical protein